jgi:pyruvate dehydrogenase E2 component (dihydrolipoamide acetyltransferase)
MRYHRLKFLSTISSSKPVPQRLRQHPKVNASWLGDKIRYNKHIHIGVAVAVEEGLLVPVVKFADNKSLAHIATEVRELANKAKNKQLQPKDWEGKYLYHIQPWHVWN